MSLCEVSSTNSLTNLQKFGESHSNPKEMIPTNVILSIYLFV